jgi:peptidoglycan L-alanyl-D-glutamate endopeptidase CwlK
MDADFQPDQRSAGNIATLLPFVRPVAIQFLQLLTAASITAHIISGLRTYAEQTALYAQGRTLPGDIVTKAPAGYSNHNFGVAFDIGIFTGAKYLDNSPLYRQAGRIGKSIGLVWGGDWKSIQDEPHFELPPKWVTEQGLSESEMLSAFRERVAAGQSIA